jgi:capsular exopolysaccharide synthesis family protein
MSRVDEAVRRAAELANATLASPADAIGIVVPPIAWEDAETLAREPFPIETAAAPERSSLRVAPRATLAGPAGMPTEPLMRDATASRTAPHFDGNGPSDDAHTSVFDHIDSRLAEKIVIDRNMLPASREQYRQLAAVLHDAQGTTGIRVIMVASAVAGEGKTLTAANLALTFSESYQKRVLLIDADLRRPSLHTVFRIETTSGLTDGLADPKAALVVRQISSRLSLLPAGRPVADPMAALTSARMQQLVSEAKENFDWVILDTPPLAVLPDAHLLASIVEGAVMVIKADSTPFDLIKRSVDALGRARILGVVLNNTKSTSRSSEYTHDYYGPRTQETASERI